MNEIKPGDRFKAILKRGKHSKTLFGVECAGDSLGTFTATKIMSGKTAATFRVTKVETKNREFYVRDFRIVKLNKES